MPDIRRDKKRNRRSAPLCESIEPRTYLTVTWGPEIISDLPGGVQTPLLAAPLHSNSSTVDLIVGNFSVFASLSGEGNGSFDLADSPPVPPQPKLAEETPFVLAHFSGSNTDAIVLSSPATGTSSVVLNRYVNNGAAVFTDLAASTNSTGLIPLSAAAGDFNDDGNTDIAVVCESPSKMSLTLEIETSSIGGLFIDDHEYTLPGSSTFSDTFRQHEPIIVGDFGNHQTDLAVADDSTGTLDIYMGNGDGSFSQLPPFLLSATLITVGQFTSSGNTDIVTAAGRDITLLTSNGDGTFTAQPPINVGGVITALTTADINLDGNLDVVTDQGILLGNGDGTFQPSVVTMPVAFNATTNNTFSNLIATDINGDGKPDLVGVEEGDLLVSDLNETLATSSISLQSSSPAAIFGTDIKFTATLSSPFSATPTGHIDFLDGSTLLGAVNVTSDTTIFDAGTTLSGGAHSITAQYSGDTSFLPVISTPLTQTLLIPSQTVLSTNHAVQNAGDVTTLTASVTGIGAATSVPTGSVQFLDNGQLIATEPLNSAGVATFTTAALAVTTHSITAQYAGDSIFLSSSSTPLTQTINQPPLLPLIASTTLPAIVVLGVPPYAKAIVKITNTTAATISGPLTVTVFASSTGTVLNASAVASLPTSRHSIRAGKSISLPISIKSISLVPGSYTLLAQITAPSGTLINTVTGPGFQVQSPIVNLSIASVGPVVPVTIKPGQGGSFTVVFTNTGNVPSSGAATITIGLSTDGVTQSVLLIAQNKPLKILPTHPLTQHLHFAIPHTQAAGTFHLIVTLTQDGSTATAVGQTQFVIS